MNGLSAIEFSYMLNQLAQHAGEAAIVGDGGEVIVLHIENGMLSTAETLTGDDAETYKVENAAMIIARPSEVELDLWRPGRDSL